MAVKSSTMRATGGLGHLLRLALVAAVFGLAPRRWSFVETLLVAAALVAIYEVALATRDCRRER